jgi:hypothetical protein
MSQLKRANIVSTEYTGNTTIVRNLNRSYFMVIMTSGTGTVEFGGGGGAVPLAADTFYEPYVTPTSEIIVTTTGTFVVVEG